MERCIDPKIINTFIRTEDPEIKKIRDDLYSLLMSDNEVNLSCVTSVTSVTNNDTYDTCDSENNISNLIKGRWLELSQPILTIAKVIDKEVYQKLEIFINKLLKKKETTDIVESKDNKFLYCLLDYIQGKNEKKFFEIFELKKHLQSTEGDEYWITNDWIGKALRRLNFIVEDGRNAKKRSVRLDFEKIELKAKTYGLDVDKIKTESKENENIQKTLGDMNDEKP